jgi:DNA-binding transcriptional MerR regulator
MSDTVKVDIGVKVKSESMLISQLARRSGISARALRHYDKQGLLPSRRLSNGYRDFEEHAVEEVRRIRLLLDIGLDLETVTLLLPCFATDGALTACPAARDRLARQIRDLDSSIAEMQRTRGSLSGTLDGLVDR